MSGPNEGRFDEHEQVEEAKFYPTPNLDLVPLEPGELPSSYGKSRLVLLPVDPYRMYAYWELAGDPAPTAGARAVLRFYQSPGRPFDVEIDLAAGNWYVHLWSPDKAYQADLGLRGEDGAFIVLAQSNTVHTPPARPEPSPMAQVAVPSETVAPSVPAAQTPVPAPLIPEPQTEIPSASVAPPVTPRLKKPTIPRVDATAILDRKLAELFALREELPPLPEPYMETDFSLSDDLGDLFEDPIPDAPLPAAIPFDLGDLEELDLTEYSEARFTPGISSEGGPLGE